MAMDKHNKILTSVNVIMALGGMVGLFFGAFFFLDERHADNEAILKVENRQNQESLQNKRQLIQQDVEFRKVVLDDQLDRKSEIRHHYKALEQNRELEPAEQARVEYLEDQLERGYKKQESYEDRLHELEKEE